MQTVKQLLNVYNHYASIFILFYNFYLNVPHTTAAAEIVVREWKTQLGGNHGDLSAPLTAAFLFIYVLMQLLIGLAYYEVDGNI